MMVVIIYDDSYDVVFLLAVNDHENAKMQKQRESQGMWNVCHCL